VLAAGDIDNDATDGAIRFWTGASQDRMIINHAGRVGIGIADPESTLHVNGILTIGGGINSKITMTSPDGNDWCCRVDNSGSFSCSSGACAELVSHSQG